MIPRRHLSFLVLVFSLGVFTFPTAAQETTETPAPAMTETSVEATPEMTPGAEVRPDSKPQGLSTSLEASTTITETLPFSPSFLDRLQLPEGIEINIFAQGLGNVRWMAVAPDGTLFVTRREEGDLIALTDANGDGMADETEPNVVVSDLPYLHGITFNGN